MARKQFTPIDPLVLQTMAANGSIDDLQDTNTNFSDTLDYIKDVQSGDSTTNPEILGVDSLKNSIHLVGLKNLNSANNLIINPDNNEYQMSSLEEIENWTTNDKLKQKTIKRSSIITGISQTTVLFTNNTHFMSALITLDLYEEDFITEQSWPSYTLRPQGVYTFTRNNENTYWVLNGSQVDIDEYGIIINYNDGIITVSDVIEVELIYNNDVTSEYNNLYSITKTSQLINNGPPGANSPYVIKRDIIIFNNLSFTLENNTDAPYNSEYIYKGIIQLPTNNSVPLYLYQEEIKSIDSYLAKITFPESYCGLASQICVTRRDNLGAPIVYFYTNSDVITTIPSIILTYIH